MIRTAYISFIIKKNKMKIIKIIVIASIFIFISCDKKGNQKEIVKENQEETTKKNQEEIIKEDKKEATLENDSIKTQLEEKLPTALSELILTENTLGNFELEKGMALDELKIKEAFSHVNVSKNLGEQDGPNYYYYEIGSEVVLTTPNTENEIVSLLYIQEESGITDEYGVTTGMRYEEVKEKRLDMHISTEHYHIYLYKKGSNIAYEMSLEDYNGPDKEEYTFDDLKNSKVSSIIWK